MAAESLCVLVRSFNLNQHLTKFDIFTLTETSTCFGRCLDSRAGKSKSYTHCCDSLHRSAVGLDSDLSDPQGPAIPPGG